MHVDMRTRHSCSRHQPYNSLMHCGRGLLVLPEQGRNKSTCPYNQHVTHFMLAMCSVRKRKVSVCLMVRLQIIACTCWCFQNTAGACPHACMFSMFEHFLLAISSMQIRKVSICLTVRLCIIACTCWCCQKRAGVSPHAQLSSSSPAPGT